MTTQSMHVSNPNPQTSHLKYKSVNRIGQDGAQNERERKMMEQLKFGRRVVFDKQQSNRALLETHLNAIHETYSNKKKQHYSSQREEREYIDRRK
jgi:hypothetical protein